MIDFSISRDSVSATIVGQQQLTNPTSTITVSPPTPTTVGALFPNDPTLTAAQKALAITTLSLGLGSNEADYLLININGKFAGTFLISNFHL